MDTQKYILFSSGDYNYVTMKHFSYCLFISAFSLHLYLCLSSSSLDLSLSSLPPLSTFPPPFSIHPSCPFGLADQRLSQRSVTLPRRWVNYSASIRLTRKREDGQRETGDGVGASGAPEKWMKEEREMMKRRKVWWGGRRQGVGKRIEEW